MSAVSGAAAGVDLHPDRPVRADDHLAPPQEVQLVERQRRGQPQRDAAAGAAGLESQHQPGHVGRAARGERPQAESPVPAAHRRHPHLGDREQRIPQQRPVGEDPPAGAGVDARASVCDSDAASCSSLSARVGVDRRRVDLAHPAALEVAAGERSGMVGPALHGIDSGSRFKRASAMFASRRIAAALLPCAPPLASSGERATGLRGGGTAGGRCFLARFMARERGIR